MGESAGPAAAGAHRSRVVARTSRHFKNKHTTQKIVIYSCVIRREGRARIRLKKS